MISSTGTIASQHLETGNDALGMGWYSHHKITGAIGHKIIFIAAYQVCKDSITSTGEHLILPPMALTPPSRHCHPNPPQQILDNLKSIILMQSDVCMAIDANESLYTSNQHFQEWIVECSLISLHENLYDKEYYDTNKIPTTHQYGSTKIDHVFCTPRLFGCVTRVGIEPYTTKHSPTTVH
jgi:hypothetical protein